MDDLLIKYILEEATSEEIDQVQQWLAANATNRAHFEKLQAAWQLAAQPNLQPATGTPQALQRLKQTLQAMETASVKRIWPRVWTAAAAVVGIVGVALGAYVWIKPKATVKEQPPVVQPDTVLQKPVQKDMVSPVPSVQPVPALDTLPFVKPHKKNRSAPVKPVQHVHPKKKRPEPVVPVPSVRPKKKRPEPVQPVHQVKKHKKTTRPASPPAPVKEPPIT